MKRLLSAALLLMASYAVALAANTKKTVAQVTGAVSLTEAVDYHISSATPFGEGGSIDIVNTDAAVLIFDALRPSLAKSYLSNVTINGAAAKDGTNCQLKMYAQGAIILPYGGSNFYPLVVFDEKNYVGNSFQNLTEGHNGSGFMKNLPKEWNNRIRSFKLKRGYMVTFALGDTGKGYSRCFIAADADLQFNLPLVLDQRITSYRLFKWYDAGKKAIADWVDASACKKLDVTSTFTWSAGTSLLPDVEVVPHHIYENWPSASDLGKANYSCHMKTNNEPANKDDDPKGITESVDDILANWESLMRTGMRLCSPSSWDGSDYWNGSGTLIKPFLDSIDARGWRCDIVDAHCYWPSGNFGYLQSNWVANYKRPIWVSEWCWGASWNNNGSFSGNESESSFANAIKNITTTMNNSAGVERYFYWNGENGNFPCKLIRDGNLTEAGNYYASMSTPLAYNGSVNYVPTNPRMNAPTNFKCTFTPSTMITKVTCTLNNDELTKKVVIARGFNSSKVFQTLKEYSAEDFNGKYSISYNDTLDKPGTYYYKIVEYNIFNQKKETKVEAVVIGGSELSTEGLQFGTVTTTPGDQSQLFFAQPFAEYPVLIGGSPSYNNSYVGASARPMVNNYILAKAINNEYKYATYREDLWLKSDGTAVAATEAATTNFIVGAPGNGTVGSLHYELGFVPLSSDDAKYVEGSISYANARTISSKDGEVVEVTFRQPFETIPVVMLSPLTINTKAPATMWRIWDVTPTGFKMMLMRQKECPVTTQSVVRVGYLAMEQGQSMDEHGRYYTVSTQEKTYTGASSEFTFAGSFLNPRMMVQLQSYNHECTAVTRLASVTENSAKVYYHVDITNSAMFISASKPATEVFGFIIISDDPVGVHAVRDSGLMVQGSPIFNLAGQRLKKLQRGLNIVNGKKIIIK